MSKFHRLQKISSIIPFLSTVIVAIITTIELKRHAASQKIWGYFILTFLASGIFVYFVNSVIMTGENPLLNIIASALIFALANILFVDFQIMSIKEAQTAITPNTKLYIIICCVIVAISTIAVPMIIFLSTAANIEDINGGANTDLAVITRDEILFSNNFSQYASHTSYKGPRTNVTGRLKEVDYQECSFRCGKISGVKTLHATKTSENQLLLEVSSQLEEGNLEIVVIVDGEYYASVPVNQTNSIVLSDIADKTVVIKIAAESAKLNISVRRQ